jgi:hypothetical protein
MKSNLRWLCDILYPKDIATEMPGNVQRVKKDEMGRACSTNGGDDECI